MEQLNSTNLSVRTNLISKRSIRIAFLLPNLNGGGLERVALNLLKGMTERELSLDLVLAAVKGPYLEDVPAAVRIIDLQTKMDDRLKSAIKIVLPLARYLRQEKPDILVAHMVWTNAVAVMARAVARVPTKLTLVEHNNLLNSHQRGEQPYSNLLAAFTRLLYRQADAVVAVSQSLAQTLEIELRMLPGGVKVIYNPVVDTHLLLNAQAPLEHSWFQADQIPVLLGVGRLVVQKDFPTLIQAFALLRQKRPARLLILGEGALRSQLQTLVNELGLATDVSMPGFVKNPYSYMSRAAVFVLSSRWEGLPTVLIEAIACGCQVVSTDCPHGPSEILAGGKYGWLVPVADSETLAQAMEQALDSPIDPATLRRRSQDFSIERAVSEYLRLTGVETG